MGDGFSRFPFSGYVDIKGSLTDGRKASLLNCVFQSRKEHFSHGDRQYETILRPNYVVVGDEFITSEQSVIEGICYHFENITSLVGGRNTFMSVDACPDDIRELLKRDHSKHTEIARKYGWPTYPFEPEIGEHPSLLYYSGRWEVIAAQSKVGVVSLTNRTTRGAGTAAGIGIDNEVTVNIKFSDAKTPSEALRELHTLHSLLELCLGSRQRFQWNELNLTQRDEKHPEIGKTARLYWSLGSARVEHQDRPYQMDVLLSPERRPGEFKKVVSSWMDSMETMGDPRERLATAFFGRYGVDRIVGAANMFDLLPETHAPKKREIDTELREAVAASRQIFATLSDSSARQSMLSALGRVGTASLRDKVYHRADKILAVAPEMFPSLHLPCRQAVLARNHYVHGGKASFDYQKESADFVFLTNTLEFVFAASDLIEMGWDLMAWIEEGSTMTHQFGRYAVNFLENVERLKVLVGERSQMTKT